MTLSLLAAFWAVSIFFVITPGVDWAYAITAGMRERAVVPAVTGLLLGHLVATLVVAAGVGVLIAGVPVAMTLMAVLGSGYLLWLGTQLLLHPPVPAAHDGHVSQSWSKWTLQGFFVSGLNPKVFLLFLALLPQFTSTLAAWPIPAQIVTLGFVHVLNCGIVYLAVGYFSSAVLRTRPQAARVVSRVSGAVMIVLALLLIGEMLRS